MFYYYECVSRVLKSMAYHLHSHYVIFACGRSCGMDKHCVAYPGGISGRELSADLVVIPDHTCCEFERVPSFYRLGDTSDWL